MRSGVTQSSPVANPDVRISIGVDTYSTQDGGRIVSVKTHEKLYGGEYTIELDNDDSTLTAKDYKGSIVALYFGFIGSSGSTLHELTVDDQGFVSVEGKLRLQLHCIDRWSRLSFYTATLGGSLWNYPEQSAVALAGRTLPSGENIPAALIAAISAQYDKTIEYIVDKTLLDTLGAVAIPEAGHVDTAYYAKKPLINGGDARSVVAQAMESSSSYLGLWTNQFKVINPSNGSVVYSYNTDDLFFSNVDFQVLVRPNKIVYHGITTLETMIYTASPHGENAASITKIGNVPEHRYYDWNMIEKLTIQGDVDSEADIAIARMLVGLSKGVIVAPMHCSQELLDKVEIVDGRYASPRTTTGYVYEILREYDRGVYRITLVLGGLATSYTPPGGSELRVAEPGLVPPKKTDWEDTLPAGLQAYIANIIFTSVDWDTISWVAGNVKLADGRIQVVDAGTLDLTGVHYLYVIWGNSTLQNSTNYGNAIGEDRVFVGVASRGSSSSVKAYVFNPFTDSILINRDKVMDGLVNDLKLASEAVTEAKIAANAVTGGKIAAQSIVGGHIQALQIDSVHINTDAITSQKISAGAITAIKIDAGAIEADKLEAKLVLGTVIWAGDTKVKLDSSGVTAYGSYFKTVDGYFVSYNGATYVGGFGNAGNILVISSVGNIQVFPGTGKATYLTGKTIIQGKLQIPVGTNLYE